MNKYESLLEIAQKNNLTVFENVQFNENVNGLIINDTIALSSRLKTGSEKKCVLAEEIAHHMVNCGDIIGLEDPDNRYQENKAHRYAVDMVLSVEAVIKAIIDLREDATISNIAERLNVTEQFLKESLDVYSRRFNGIMEYKGYYIVFNPQIHVFDKDKYFNCG